MNLVLSTVMVFKFTEYYWIYQAIKSLLMLIKMWQIRLRKKEYLYFCEFCWWMSHLFIFYTLIKILKAHGMYTVLSDIPGISKSVFYFFWAFANGPLALSVILYN